LPPAVGLSRQYFQEQEDVPLPIIFTHYGFSDYLRETLKCATVTNPAAERILIGDALNKDVAEEFGWTHVDGDALPSELRTAFLQYFEPIAGPLLTTVKNGRDWLRYVSERWFIVEAFCQARKIERFWHFDSDTMIVEDIGQFEGFFAEAGITHTMQCNENGMNGYVTLEAASEFCKFMVSIYRDEDKKEELQGWRERFRTIEKGGGFTEMLAYSWFARDKNYHGPHLESLFDGWWFDDCICQDDGFETARMNFVGRFIKRINFDGHAFWGRRDSQPRRFATVNCSWVHETVFKFLLECVEQRASGKYRARSLANEWFGFRHFIKAGGRSALLASGVIKA
jgi:hypothetical protein